ncbi:oligosaccharide flippase family protein [Desertivirga xinjiangensis]|uniref:oligosaccharide flippase family protein n=1 Tax=Desertivirga xinjiangensis TaxID=539206 RepID=UPI00210D375F|nr:oligosaccharide flippase family protein [Pedobacter xinjiangensis]
MSRSKNAIGGLFADIGGLIITQILTFLAVPIYLSHLSNISYGYWLTIGSIVMWISLSDFGIGMALSRLLIKVQSDSSRTDFNEEVSKLVATSLVIFASSAFLFLLLGVLLYPFCLIWFDISDLDTSTFQLTFYVTLIAGALSLPTSVFSGILESSQKLALNRNLTSIGSIVNIIISIWLVVYFKNIIGLAYALLVSVIVRALISGFFSLQLVKLSRKHFRYEKNYATSLLTFGGYFQIARIANTVATNSDNIFISSFLSSSFVPIYSFTSKMAQVFSITLASKIPNVLFAGISQIIDLNEDERLQRLFQLLLKLLIRLAIITACYNFFFNEIFVMLWVGKGNYAGDGVNYVMCYWIIYEFIVRGTTALVYAFGELKGYASISVFEIIGNIVLSIILVKTIGLIGVAIATAISRTFTTGVYLLVFFRRKRLVNWDSCKLLADVSFRSLPSCIVFFCYKISVDNLGWLDLIFVGLLSVVINFISFDIVTVIKNRHLSLREIFYATLFKV